MTTTGSKSHEFKLTAATAGVGILGVMADMLRGGTMVSDNLQMAMLICITLIGISYNVSRGLAKYETVPQEPTGGDTGGVSSELKLTIAGAGAGALPMLLELMQGRETVTDKVSITLIGCVTALIVSYNVAQGMAKYEHRGGTPTVPPGASPQG